MRKLMLFPRSGSWWMTKQAKCCTILKEGEGCFVQRTGSGLLEPRGGFREEDVEVLSGIVEPSVPICAPIVKAQEKDHCARRFLEMESRPRSWGRLTSRSRLRSWSRLGSRGQRQNRSQSRHPRQCSVDSARYKPGVVASVENLLTVSVIYPSQQDGYCTILSLPQPPEQEHFIRELFWHIILRGAAGIEESDWLNIVPAS